VHVITDIHLPDGRRLASDSIDFRMALPISATLLDRIASIEKSSVTESQALWESISVLAAAIVALESRGVEFPDADD